jgi:hypothetical protein
MARWKKASLEDKKDVKGHHYGRIVWHFLRLHHNSAHGITPTGKSKVLSHILDYLN